MPTRRVVLENTLVLERVRLWADMGDAVEADPYSARTGDLVNRIRAISEALGYPTEWLAVPGWLLNWYVYIETVPALGIAAQPVDWRDVFFEVEEFDAGLQSHYRYEVPR